VPRSPADRDQPDTVVVIERLFAPGPAIDLDHPALTSAASATVRHDFDQLALAEALKFHCNCESAFAFRLAAKRTQIAGQKPICRERWRGIVLGPSLAWLVDREEVEGSPLGLMEDLHCFRLSGSCADRSVRLNSDYCSTGCPRDRTATRELNGALNPARVLGRVCRRALAGSRRRGEIGRLAVPGCAQPLPKGRAGALRQMQRLMV
jgi:hypothetical protein